MYTVTDFTPDNRSSEQAQKERYAENIYLWKIFAVLEEIGKTEDPHQGTTISILIR